MKFLSDLGSCYRRSAQVRRLQPEEPSNRVQVILVSGCNETWSKPRRKKMNVSKYWRPELSVISEDRVASFLEIDRGKTQYHHQPAKKASSKSNNTNCNDNKTRSNSKAKPAPRSFYYNDDYNEYHPRKNYMPVMISAFSPPPFMF